MRDELQNAGNTAFHVVHAGTVEVHVAGLGWFAKPVAIGKSSASASAIDMWCSIFRVMRVVTPRGRDSDWDLGREVAVFSVLIPSNTTSLRRWSSGLLLYGLGWRVIWKGGGSEKGVGDVGPPGRDGPRERLRRRIGLYGWKASAGSDGWVSSRGTIPSPRRRSARPFRPPSASARSFSR